MNGRDSEAPVVGRARLTVCLGHIDLSDLSIALHHLQRAMPKERLQGEKVTAARRYAVAKACLKR